MGEAVTKARVTLREEQRTYGPQVREQVTGPDDVCGLLWDHVFATAPREKFVACLLNTANVVQTFVVVAKGTINSTIISPREIYQAALLDNASAIICAHNHPSGNPEPSRDDVQITRQIGEAGAALNVPCHDHLIVTGEETYTSLAERGAL